MKRVITTVGISIFTNAIKKEKEKKLSVIDRRLTTYLKDDPLFEKWNCFTEDIEGEDGLRTLFYNAALKDGCKASAEIESLIAIAKTEGDLEVVLLATDTVLSVLACELICKWFNDNEKGYPSVKVQKDGKEVKITCCFNRDEFVVTGLQVEKVDVFEKIGFHQLFKIIGKILEDKRIKSKETIFNISGGYKAIIPFITLYAQLEKISLKYIYENSNSVITVGNLAFSFDWDIIEAVVDNLNNDFLQSLPMGHDLLKGLFDLNLIEYKEDVITKDLKPHVSILGQMMNSYLWKSPVSNTTLGLFLEYKLAYYFSRLNKFQYKNPEKTNIGLYYKKQKDNYEFSENENNRVEIGDVDILLDNTSEEKVWAEVKAFNTYIRFKLEIGQAKDEYYRQVKPRILGYKHKCKKYPKEFIFIIYKTRLHKDTFQGVETNQDFIYVTKYFRDKVEADFSEQKIIFRLFYCFVDLRLSDLKLHYDELLKNPFSDNDIIEYSIPK